MEIVTYLGLMIAYFIATVGLKGFFIFLLSAIVIITIGSWLDSCKHTKKKKKFNKSELDSSFVEDGENRIIKLISDKYYNLDEEIKFNTYNAVSADYIITLLSKKKIFQGNNKFSCTVMNNIANNSKNYDVKISVKYTQGFKVLMASVNSLLEHKLNSTEIKVLNEIKRIFTLIIKPNMNPYQKEKAVHDYLIKTSMYDANALNSNNIPEESHTPYGLLFNYKGVCDAYAETFQIFMYLCGIESYVVIGDTIHNTNKEYNHAWNIVKLGKFYYHTDVTFDNPGPMRFGQIDYKYFNKSDTEMDETHKWDAMSYPFCLDY